MNQIPRCDWLPKWARWSYTARSGLIASSRKIKDHFWCFIPCNKSFIDQACSVKMAGYWPSSVFCVFMDLDFVSVHKHAKKELDQYPAILTSPLVINSYIWFCDVHQYNESSFSYLRIFNEIDKICGVLKSFVVCISCWKS